MSKLDEKTNEDIFLECFNDFLTISKMAEHYGCSRFYLETRINQGRKDHFKKHDINNK